MLRLTLFLSAVVSCALAENGIRGVYRSAVNPASFSLQGAVVEPTLDLSWSPLPFPNAFGALWTATIASPFPGQLVWFSVSFGASSSSSRPGSFLKLWVDDHLIVNAQSNSPNTTTVALYPLVIEPGGSRLRVEFAAIGEAAFAQVHAGPSASGPWALVPSSLLTPTQSAAEDTYQSRRSVEERGWNTWDTGDMLSSVRCPLVWPSPCPSQTPRAARSPVNWDSPAPAPALVCTPLAETTQRLNVWTWTGVPPLFKWRQRPQTQETWLFWSRPLNLLVHRM